MAIIKPFKGIRPAREKAHVVASLPYDVLNSDEARIEAKDNPFSFLHVLKPEIDLPVNMDPHDPRMYEKARNSFRKMVNEGIFLQDEEECLYVYSQTMDGKTQYGLVARSEEHTSELQSH